MPLFDTRHINKDSILAVWKIEETIEELESQVVLLRSDKEVFDGISQEKRKKEWLASRILAQRMLNEEVSIIYDTRGKPLIQGTYWEISISHKDEYVGIILGRGQEVAIDIEHLSKRLDKVYRKFIREDEFKQISRISRGLQIHLHWCIKECLLKLAGRKDIKPLIEMCVDPIDLKQPHFYGETREYHGVRRYEFTVDYLTNNYIAVWSCGTPDFSEES